MLFHFTAILTIQISYPEELHDLGDIEDLINILSENNTQDICSKLSDDYSLSNLQEDESLFDNLTILENNDLIDNIIDSNSETYEPPVKRHKKVQIDEDNFTTFNNHHTYSTLIKKFSQNNYDFCLKNAIEVFNQLQQSTQYINNLTSSFIWSSFDIFYRLMTNNFEIKNFLMPKFTFDMCIEDVLKQNFMAVLQIINCINEDKFKLKSKIIKNMNDEKILLIESIDFKTFIKSNMKEKLSILKDYSEKIIINKKSALFYIAKEYLKKKLSKLSGGIDVLLFKIYYLRIISQRNLSNCNHKIVKLVYLCEVYYKNPEIIKNLSFQEFSDYIHILYNIPNKYTWTLQLSRNYNFIRIIEKTNIEKNEVKFYSNLIVLIIPFFINESDIIFVLENQENIYYYLKKNSKIYFLVKYYILGLIKITETVIN